MKKGFTLTLEIEKEDKLDAVLAKAQALLDAMKGMSKAGLNGGYVATGGGYNNDYKGEIRQVEVPEKGDLVEDYGIYKLYTDNRSYRKLTYTEYMAERVLREGPDITGDYRIEENDNGETLIYVTDKEGVERTVINLEKGTYLNLEKDPDSKETAVW